MKEMNQRASNIGVIVVTYNRLEKLKKALNAYAGQNLLPKYVLIVDNASSDGTREFLDVWKEKEEYFDKIVLSLDSNGGGSGGFYAGEKEAVSLHADWIMLADDDAYPEADYIEGMQNFIDSHNCSQVSAICGIVVERGKVSLNHRGHLRKLGILRYQNKLKPEELKEDKIDVDVISYVGITISMDKLKKAGFVNPGYFIWNDDVEHCMRLRKFGKLFCIPQYSLIHDFEAKNSGLNWKTYYGWRNQIDMYRRHFPVRFVLGTMYLLGKTCLLPLKGNRWMEMCLRFAAIHDGVFGNLGLHKKYRPGWKP